MTQAPAATSSWILYHYWRSSSSWRVRMALAYKGLHLGEDVRLVAVNLVNGESEASEHVARNPLGYVPVLEISTNAGSRYLVESVAIIEWLEETMAKNPLFPTDRLMKAQTRALVEVINADTQPLGNLTVLDQVSSDEERRKQWAQHFIRRGLNAYQDLRAVYLSAENSSKHLLFSLTEHPLACDLFLVPQCYNAIRFGVDLRVEFPALAAIYEHVLKQPWAHASHPDRFH